MCLRLYVYVCMHGHVCVCVYLQVYIRGINALRTDLCVFVCERVCIVMWGLTTLHLIRWDISDYLLQRKSQKIKKKKKKKF